MYSVHYAGREPEEVEVQVVRDAHKVCSLSGRMLMGLLNQGAFVMVTSDHGRKVDGGEADHGISL